MSDKIPNLPNYEIFMKATNKSTVFILAFMNFLMEMNRKKESEIHYMDSTPITVCMNHKIYSHKVTKSIAAYTINRNLDFYRNFFRLRLI